MLSQERMTSSQECERAWVEVDLAALGENTRRIKGLLSPSTELMAVVKADAYGHGAVMVARKVLQQGASSLGVATITEGIELRQAGIDAPILVFGAVNTLAEVQAIAQWQLQATLSSPKQALIFSRHLEHPCPVHLVIDTGMGRLGCPQEQSLELIKFVYRLPHLTLAGLCSHLAMADAIDPGCMEQQRCQFEQVVQQVRCAGIPLPPLHLANSAATLRSPQFHYNLVRVGLALYGLYPSPHLRSRVELQPVLQVRARITLVKTIAAGSGVSYGHQFVAPQPMRIAVVGIGYADGVPRNLSNRMSVLLRGQRVPQIGVITMDQLIIDVTGIENVQEGDVVTLIGEDGEDPGATPSRSAQPQVDRITVEEWAHTLGTISWEILCNFKQRLPRIAV